MGFIKYIVLKKLYMYSVYYGLFNGLYEVEG